MQIAYLWWDEAQRYNNIMTRMTIKHQKADLLSIRMNQMQSKLYAYEENITARSTKRVQKTVLIYWINKEKALQYSIDQWRTVWRV